MAKDILIREQEFLKMNEELDKKTKSFIDKTNNPILLKSTTIRQSSIKKSLILSKSPTNDIVDNNNITKQIPLTTTTINKKLPRKSNTLPRHYRDVLTSRKPLIKDKKSLNIDIELYGKLPNKKTNNISSISSPITESILTPTSPLYKYSTKYTNQSQLVNNNNNNNKTDIIKSPEKLSLKNSKLNKKEQQSSKLKLNNNSNNNNNNNKTPIQSPKKTNKNNNNNIDYLKSLNTETNEILQETFRNKKFSYSISSENLADSKITIDYDETESVNNIETKSQSNAETVKSPEYTDKIKTTGRSSITSSTWKTNCSTNKTDGSITNATGIKKNISPNGLIKYLKTKVQILEEELETNTNLLMKRNKELEKSYEQHKKMEKQRDQAISKNNTLTEQLGTFEDKLKILDNNYKENDTKLKLRNRELDDIKRELKLLKQTNINLENRLYRSNEELDNYKINLNQTQLNEREFKESIRIEKETIEKQINQLKKQRLELIGAYKKQLYLIDNLKRQNLCMEQAKMIGFGEKEFTKVLDWNSNNNNIKK